MAVAGDVDSDERPVGAHCYLTHFLPQAYARTDITNSTMSAPTTDGDDTSEELKEELEDRAVDVLEDGEFVSFEEHNENRD